VSESLGWILAGMIQARVFVVVERDCVCMISCSLDVQLNDGF